MFRKFLFSAIVLVALSVLFYRLKIEPDWSRTLSEEGSQKLLPISDAGKIQAIAIRRSDADVCTLKKENGRWIAEIPRPGAKAAIEPAYFQEPAGDLLAHGMAVALAQLKKEGVFTATEQARADYGLTAPVLRLEIGWGERGEVGTLSIGAVHPIEKKYYAAWSHRPDEIFLVKAELKEALDKSAYTLMNKKIFPFPAGDLTNIRVTLFGVSLAFFRNDAGAWQLASAPDRAINQDTVKLFVEALGNVYIKEFLAEKWRDEETMGLVGSVNGIFLNMRDGTAQTLMIGRALDEKNAYYAKRGPGEGSQPVLVAKPNIHALMFPPEEFFEK